MKNASKSTLAWFLLILLSLIWGSSFILIKKSLVTYSPLEVGCGRIVISFLAFLPLLIHHIKSIPRGKYLPLFIVGICGSGLPAILYAIGQTHIQSAVAGVLNSLTPVFTFILAVVIFKQRFIFHQLAGITLALLGIMVLFFIKVEGSISVPVFYAALILMATLFYAISANTVKAYLGDVKPIMISVVSFAMIGPFALIYLINSSFIEHTTQSP
ncbi:MAG: DMT family transporter, partial [Saprospiraceae bacterium]|nr:DMT family transporter [Saprospiraceae bacterium]